MPVKLYPGTYRFVCGCDRGHLWEPFELKRVMPKMEPFCFYCKQTGKFIKIMDQQYWDFSYNWNNKLNCVAFSTIRLRNDKKYYVGAKGIVRLKGHVKGSAKIVSVSHLKIDKINEAIARLDTGYSAEECRNLIKEMYKNKMINWATQELSFSILVYDKKNEQEGGLFDGM